MRSCWKRLGCGSSDNVSCYPALITARITPFRIQQPRRRSGIDMKQQVLVSDLPSHHTPILWKIELKIVDHGITFFHTKTPASD